MIIYCANSNAAESVICVFLAPRRYGVFSAPPEVHLGLEVGYDGCVSTAVPGYYYYYYHYY
eukprot:4734890-Heterocapsa_arctica.AAC.1